MSIENEIDRINTAKQDIKSAIEDKGVSVPDDARIDDYSQYIQGLVNPSDVVTSVNGEKGDVLINKDTLGLADIAYSGNYRDLIGAPEYSLPTATATVLGGVKSSTTGTTSNRYYNVQVNADGTMRVNVPWTDTYSWTSITGKPSWVNSSTKPSYSWGEITGKPNVATTSDLSGYVTLDTQQTIAGRKTFGQAITCTAKSTSADTTAEYFGDKITSFRDGEEYNLSFPSKSGTLALLSDIPKISDKYPVFSIYISTSSTSPSSLFGGSWTEIGRDTFLMAAGSGYTSGRSGGSNSITLSIDQIPEHTHYGLLGRLQAGSSTVALMGYSDEEYRQGMTSVGGGQPFDNRPAYYTVHIWRRTA